MDSDTQEGDGCAKSGLLALLHYFQTPNAFATDSYGLPEGNGVRCYTILVRRFGTTLPLFD
jgi:hypothetical protein